MNTSFLANLHPHCRDARISFDEGPHIYTIDGDSEYTSVTKWNHSHFEEFDADSVIKKMMNSNKWSESAYFGKTPDEIKETWDKTRDEAAAAGTKMHYDIECFYNQCPNQNDSVEYSYFMRFTRAYPHLKPYRTEWMIWDKTVRLAGSVDMVFKTPDGGLEIYDWKRCKTITKTNNWNKFANTEVISHLPDTNYWHYCLQLNTYKAILERNYGVCISGMYLVCLHPNNFNNSYLRIKVADLQNEVSDLLTERLKQIS